MQIIKLFFLCVLDTEINMLDYLQSKNHEWIVLIYLAKQSCFPYVLCLKLPHSRDIHCPWLPTIPSASPPCLFVSPFTQVLKGWEMLFIFWKLLAVLFCLWFPEEWLCWVSEQLLRADPSWRHTSHGTLSITLLALPLRQDSYLSNGMTHFSVLSVLKYQVN